MPELPEVETVRRVLEPGLSGRRITSAEVFHPSVIAHPSAEDFPSLIMNRSFISLGRRGKFLIAGLDDGSSLIIHLRMTGCLLITPSGYPKEKHTHVILHLDNNTELRFSDMRRFGRLWLIGNNEEDEYSGIRELGPEPCEGFISSQYLISVMGKRRTAIKECLMNQHLIAGIGNIYSDEILFRSFINPARSSSSITESEWKRLAAVIPACMEFFIEKNSISAEDYLRTKGQDYRNTPYIEVYGHGESPCPRCGTPLKKTVIGGRSSVFCPSCQPEKR